VTIEELGLARELNESGRYDAVKPKLFAFDQKTQGREMRKYGAAPDVFIGSAHAVTETGSILIASLTGSQLPGIAYAAGKVILVVGAQKIVKDLEEGMQRVKDHVTPLESVRARKAYGLPEAFQSFASKLLVLNREVNPGRVKVIIVNEALGF
jgi:L-lactate utilization protein LutC